jgi:hypothetical protein
MDKRNDGIGMFPPIGKNQGWVIEFILDENIYIWRKPETEIVSQVCNVISPGQRDDLDSIPF